MNKQSKQKTTEMKGAKFITEPTPEIIFLEMENYSTKDIIDKLRVNSVLIPLMSAIPDNNPNNTIPPSVLGSAIIKDISDDYDMPTYRIQCITRNTIYDFVNVQAFITAMRNIIRGYSNYIMEYRNEDSSLDDEPDRNTHLILVNADEFGSVSDSLSASAAMSRLIEDYWNPVQKAYPSEVLHVVFTFNRTNIDDSDGIFNINKKDKKKKKSKKKKGKK